MNAKKVILIGIGGVLVLALVAYKAKSWITSWRRNYVVGTFQGEFSLDRTRVRIAPDKTGMVVAKIEANGVPAWMLSFSGLSPGRAAQHVVLPDGSVVAVGVFESELRSLEAPNHPLLRTEDKQGVFTLKISSDGRIIAKTLVASGEEFRTPFIKFHDAYLVVEVRHNGRLSVGGKAANDGIDSPVLHLELSPSGEIMRWEASGAEAAGVAEPAAPVPLSLSQCEVCRWHTPMYDPACRTVRVNVCTFQGHPWCCNTQWDRLCMDAAFHIPGVSCTCAHDPHVTGELLPPECQRGCGQPTCDPNCAAEVDDIDGYCGSNANDWNDLCVSNATICQPN